MKAKIKCRYPNLFFSRAHNNWLGTVAVIILAFCQAHLFAGDLCPWVLPWNDGSETVISRAYLNQPILNESERICIDSKGHFVRKGQRIRLLGVNFAGDSPFMPTNKADAVAARLAKFGINSVRFHHIDAPWATGGGIIRYTPTTSLEINYEQLNRLHYLVAALARHGIYANINLLTGREFRSGDGLGWEVATMDPKDQHILGMFYEPALELQKQFARELLTTPNPYRGMSLSQDPAVGFVEIINENGLVQKWLEGRLDKLPKRYRARLEEKWNEWLKARYKTTEALLVAWKPIVEPLGRELIQNGGFQQGLEGWNIEQHDGAVARAQRVLDEKLRSFACRIETVKSGTAEWHVQLNQAGLKVEGGRVYTLVFSARSETQSAKLSVSLMQAHEPWATLGFSRTYNLTTNWATFTNVIMVSATDTNARVNFSGLGLQIEAIRITNVSLREGGELGMLPHGTSLEAGTVPLVDHSGEGFVGTESARCDLVRFLGELEKRYYKEMVKFLREDCGYRGLIWGTILANSPISIQAELDVIDTHAYWHHPVFPGRPWDPDNWYVVNESILNHVDSGNTIARLARVRVRGKPFTVSEYQHPSPNEFGAEGPLLIAAYAALQDWDGIWLFDYGPGQDTAPMGQFRGFFDIGQHPTKMAHVLVAANLFRRADVRVAQDEYQLDYDLSNEAKELAVRGVAWNVTDPERTGIPVTLPLQSRVCLVPTTTHPRGDVKLPAPSSKRVVSDTGELLWDVSIPGRGVFVVQTPRTVGVVGFVRGRTFTVGQTVFEFGYTDLDWAAVTITSLRSNALWEAGSALLTAVGRCENTGMKWKDATHTSVGREWGTAPTRIELIPVRVTLPVRPESLEVYALDERGSRRERIAVREIDGRAAVELGGQDCTFWFELVVKAPKDYAEWAERFFSRFELLDPRICSPNAAGPDGRANVVHYAVGWPPKVPIPEELLPSLVWGANGNWLELVFPGYPTRDDVEWLLQGSVYLGAWQMLSSSDFSPGGRVVVCDMTDNVLAATGFFRVCVRFVR